MDQYEAYNGKYMGDLELHKFYNDYTNNNPIPFIDA